MYYQIVASDGVNMGYWTRLHLVDVFIKKECVAQVNGYIKMRKNIRNETLKRNL